MSGSVSSEDEESVDANLPELSLQNLDEILKIINYSTLAEKTERGKAAQSQKYPQAAVRLFKKFLTSPDYEEKKATVLPRLGLLFKRLRMDLHKTEPQPLQ